MKSNTCSMTFHMAQVKYVNFLHRLIKVFAAAHAYVSPRQSRFILDAMSWFDHVVFVWLCFKKRNEIKKTKRSEQMSEDLKSENEQSENENKTKMNKIKNFKNKIKKKN